MTKASVTLKWLPPANDGGNAIFNYVVEMRQSGTTKWSPASLNVKVPETTFTVKDVIEGNTYEFRVAAENKAGVGPASPPSAPVTCKDPIREFAT